MIAAVDGVIQCFIAMKESTPRQADMCALRCYLYLEWAARTRQLLLSGIWQIKPRGVLNNLQALGFRYAIDYGSEFLQILYPMYLSQKVDFACKRLVPISKPLVLFGETPTTY